MKTKKLLGAALVACALTVVSLAQVSLLRAADAVPGKVSPPTPRLPNGQVDLGGNGVWALSWITDFSKQMVGPDKGKVPFLPWTRAMFEYNTGNKMAYDPEGFCLPPGGPRAFGTPYPAQFLQEKDRIVVIFEGGAHVWREIRMDRSTHPGPDELNPTYFGDAIGRWEGDTLVVDTVGYNERTWLNFGGYMHTESLHTVERFTRTNRDTLHYEALIDDAEAYSEPWTVAWDIRWSEGTPITEYICQENNQFLTDLKDDFGEPFFKVTDGHSAGKRPER